MNFQETNYPKYITYLTLISAIVGFSTIAIHPFFVFFFAPILIFPKLKAHYFAHSYRSIASLTTTTFVFGLINGYTYLCLLDYLQGIVPDPPIFSIYLSLMTVYHYFQFQLINNFHHKTLAWQSFLIYHSQQYFLANLFSLTEHIISRYLLDFSFKRYHSLMFISFFVSCFGEILRITAFFTCKSNFTHIVKQKIYGDHQLITNGIYSILRHPSYTGYFYFSVFGQIFLGNIVSSIIFFIVLSRFFNDRIFSEQRALLYSFPEYQRYKEKTYILIPFVKDPKFRPVSQSEDSEEDN